MKRVAKTTIALPFFIVAVTSCISGVTTWTLRARAGDEIGNSNREEEAVVRVS